MKLVLFDIGALCADHLGCYGCRIPTSPALDSLAASGLCCDAAFSSDATTAGARAALFSGRFGIATGVVTDGRGTDTIIGHTPVSEHGLDAPRPLLQEHLSARGVLTAAVTPFGRQPARWFHHGWHQVHDPWAATPPSNVNATDVNAVALPWLQQHAAQDFFLLLAYNNLQRRADAPLTAAEQAYRRQLAIYGDPAWPDDQAFARHLELHAAFSPRAWGASTREEMGVLVHGYHARIRAVDDAVAEVLRALETLGIGGETAVVVVSDQGLLFGECGCYGGTIGTQYHSVRVPLIVRAPGMGAPGTRLACPCYTLDLAPTISQMFGFEPPQDWHGIPLSSQAQGGASARTHVVCSHGHYTAQRAVIAGEWKLNRTWHSGFWDFPDTELYHLVADPCETDNRAPHEAQRVMGMLRLWRQWHDQYKTGHADPIARVACDEPPGFVQCGQELRARVRSGGLKAPAAYRGRWA